MSDYGRRDFLKGLGTLGLCSAFARPLAGAPRGAAERRLRARVLIVGGGFGGATCAKYIRRLAPSVDLTLVEPNRRYLTCPMSNAVLAGFRPLDVLSHGYERLRQRHRIEVLHERVVGLDPVVHTIRLESGSKLAYDRLVIAPGIDFKWGSPEGYDEAASLLMPHAWKAGAQTGLLAEQLRTMADGGVVAISVPRSPFRCPPGPYERASLIAHHLKKNQPRSKILILDANDKFSKQALFLEAWKALYPGMIQWIPVTEDGEVRRVEGKSLYTELEQYRVAVANIIPAQQAGRIALQSGLADDSGWCPVTPRTFESTRVRGVHVIGDASQAGPMPKSASSANSQAKACALAVVAYLRGDEPEAPFLHNTCYSLAAPDYGISISGIYRLGSGGITAVEGAGGVSPERASREFRAKEAQYTLGWYDSIVADSFG